jgi:hypothetical protein
MLASNLSLVSEHLPLEDIPRITIPSGERQIKRIAFLADVRNRALRPLDDFTVQFDKLIFINDVLFDPIEAVQLLFSTNIDANGRTQYGAVCAVDFINAFKFYDYFATRDFEGNGMGLQFFPWFADAGDAISRKDAIAQKDAVRVRSCWGGMTAFEASWFQKSAVNTPSTRMEAAERFPNLPLSPLRFRYEEDPFWEASEVCIFAIYCLLSVRCLVHERFRMTALWMFLKPCASNRAILTSLLVLPHSRRPYLSSSRPQHYNRHRNIYESLCPNSI